MIYLDSRYSDGPLFYGYHTYKDEFALTVFRTWANYNTKFFIYEVTEIDRIEHIAAKTIGDPSLWWKIMDINPEVINPFEIPVGTQLRIPNE
jgi:hypothetical protein